MSDPKTKHQFRGLAAVFSVISAGLALLVVLLVLLSKLDESNEGAAGYVPLAYVAFAILFAVFAVSFFVQRADIRFGRGFPWLVGFTSFFVSFIPWWGLSGGNPDLGTLIYRGLKVPQGIIQFWDLSLVMQSVDCARWGFDIYQENNGCLQDPSIYAPGMVWLQYVPFEIFSQANVAVLGVGMMVVSSLVLFWLARTSVGLGQIVLLFAAVGAPWLLLLERGNIDAVVLWVGALVALVVRRWGKSGSVLWPWILAAAAIWVVGTWKYYPFALGIMLIPLLWIRRGWIVLGGFAVASGGYLIATWENFQFSAASNSNMIEFGDYVVLGREPVVARMAGSGNFWFFALALAALGSGYFVTRTLNRKSSVPFAMLAAGGGAVYLSSVLVAGFGYGYKAAFLLLAVPLVSALLAGHSRIVLASSLAVTLLIGIQSIVVWNTVLATLSGVTAASFAVGAGLGIMFHTRLVRQLPEGQKTTVVRTNV